MGPSGLASGGADVLDAFASELKDLSLNAELGQKCAAHKVGCLGLCSMDVLVELTIKGDKTTYKHVRPPMVRRIVREHILQGTPVTEWLAGSKYEAFYAKQERRVLANCGIVDPENINSCLAAGGYRAAEKTLKTMSSEAVINEVGRSGLRGRGGSGFPTGRKWELCRNSVAEQKYIICNADEGDPGAFMDRAILEGNPHLILEGMLIGAYAIGCDTGYIYVRAEYPIAVERMNHAIEEARARGFLGSNIFGTGFNFDVKIKLGAGAFICGEETALIASIEGRRGMPMPRPPFPVVKGLWGKPTVINNVETFANIPLILRNGAEWYKSAGTERSKGTKVFALTGRVKNTGLIEVPMGITLREIIYDIGGGIDGGKRLKAVQTGGPSGGCIPSDMIDIKVDYESLAEVGSIMGSGGMIVLDQNSCMVNMARYFVAFTQSESCGKCVPCRIGTKRLLEILDRITVGDGRDGDIELLESLSNDIKATSLCGLGQSAPNPVLSTIKYFRGEYEEHIKNKKCRGLECREIVSSACQHTCPVGTEASVYIALIAQGRFEEAVRVIRKDNPLASVCGRACHHPCETACRAGETGQPVAIRALKRFALDLAQRTGISVNAGKECDNGKKVAVIGSGPSGLTAGYFLALRGYHVVIFEAKPVIGGMLRVAIPPHRLPKEALDNDIRFIKEAGVRFRTEMALGRDFTIDDLFASDYQAVYLAIGSNKPKRLAIEGESSKGVMLSLQFLEDINLGREITLGKRVVVLGGGNSAVDSARAAMQTKGVDRVTIVYRRTESDMTAYREEVIAAQEEGIAMQFLAMQVRIISSDGSATGLQCIHMKVVGQDSAGKSRVEAIEGSEFIIDADCIVVAIGEQPDSAVVDSLEISGDNTIVVDPERYSTRRKGVFAGGDVVTGPNNIMNSILAGRRASESIDSYLRGDAIRSEFHKTKPSRYIELADLPEEELSAPEQSEVQAHLHQERIGHFVDAEPVFSEVMAIKEARRCQRCELNTVDGQKAFREIAERKRQRTINE
jgi:NADH-quinone oxidoreductase subunit F